MPIEEVKKTFPQIQKLIWEFAICSVFVAFRKSSSTMFAFQVSQVCSFIIFVAISKSFEICLVVTGKLCSTVVGCAKHHSFSPENVLDSGTLRVSH